MGIGAGAGSGWEHDAAMGSLVSSRSPSPSLSSAVAAAAAGGGAAAVDNALMEQLASRLGVILPLSSPYASCYSSPVGSPCKPAPTPFWSPLLRADATRLSCFAASSSKLSRVASRQSLLGEPVIAPSPGSAQQHASDRSSTDSPSRKRKALGGKSMAKEAATTATPKSREPETRAKKWKLSADAANEERKPAEGEAGHGNGKGKEVTVEPPKDYIHVRPRRGQATDSHSLAERVRREKISERMKLLQGLVPACSKVTGKALMLDEIINYVQSLQRQVEFSSMKLSTVNPRQEIGVDSFVPKDANQPCAPAASSLPSPPVYSLEDSSPAIRYASSQGTAPPIAVTSAKSFATPPTFANHGIPDDSFEGFHNASSQLLLGTREICENIQIGSLWE